MRRKFFVVLFLWLAALRPAFATSQLIVNGGFEGTSADPWVLGGTSGVQIVNGSGAYQGSQWLSMGNAAGAIQYAYQTVQLPTNLIGATLSFAYYTISSNPSGDDTFTVYITDTSFNPLFKLGTATSASPTGGWVYVTTNFISYAGQGMLSDYAGEAVNVYFYVTTDATSGNLTQFDVDDVSLVVGTPADIPSNDDFTNATFVPSAGITNAVTTTYASKETGEPNIGDNAGGHSLWWTWTAPAIGTVTIATTGSSFNTLLGVYTGTNVTNLTAVTNSDGVKRNGGLAYLTFGVTPGTQYHIGLDGYNGQSGAANFILQFTQDTTPPMVKITSPTSGAAVNSPTVELEGSATDNVAVAAVYFQVENANGSNAWQLASGTNTWTATVTNLIPGTNTIRVEAYDTSTNVSKPALCLLNYIVQVPLGLTIIGKGTVAGATNGKPLNLDYPYTLTATAAAGFHFEGWTGNLSTNSAALHFTMESNFSVTATFVDVTKPTLSITSPTSGEHWSNAMFNVTGKASDNVGVATVWFELNSKAWATNAMSNNHWTNWNTNVTLNPGTNTLKAYAEDAAGNVSLTNSVSFVYVLSAPLMVETNGHGTIKQNYNNTLLAIGNTYTMTATAGSGYVFSNWTTSYGAAVTNGPTLKFTMASNLNYIANFVPNPFTAVAGTYQGLFYNMDDMTPVSSGFFSAQVTGSGSFTAKFQQGNAAPTFTGQFSLTGTWSTNALKTLGNTAISLQLDLNGGNVIEGGLTNAAWVAQLKANRAIPSPAPQAGKKFTLVLPPQADSTTGPGGYGFGTVSVTTAGSVTLGCTLGDGTSVTPTAYESEDWQWPVYAPLDSGSGMLLGWLAFTNEPGADIDGVLYWFKPAQPSSALYKAGFTNEIQAIGSAYSFSSGERVLNLTNGYALIENGGLTQSVSNEFTLAANNLVAGSNKLQLTFTTSTGLFKGSATNAQGKTISISGAVLQKQTNGFGQFLNGAQSGGVILAPD